jgi:hypothetical protein
LASASFTTRNHLQSASASRAARLSAGSVGVYDVTAGVEDPESEEVPYGFGEDRRRSKRNIAVISGWRPRPNFLIAATIGGVLVALGLYCNSRCASNERGDAAGIVAKLEPHADTVQNRYGGAIHDAR